MMICSALALACGIAARGLAADALPLAVSVTGSVDTAYTYNLARPADRLNAYRVFDSRHNTMDLRLVDLIVQRPATLPGSAGFRVDVDLGQDVPVFQASGLNPGGIVDLQQAMAIWVAPVGSGLTLSAGKFVTLHGAEVIESADDWNSSRSFLFGYAIPFTHTGISAAYAWGPAFSATLALVNGWDNVVDNNRGKTGHAMVKIAPDVKASVVLSGSYGPEHTGRDGEMRWLGDAVCMAGPFGGVTLALNGDFAGDAAGGAGPDSGSYAHWAGAAAYLRYEPADAFAATARWEIFQDGQGARTGLHQILREATLTLAYRPSAAFETRLEIRRDTSGAAVFSGSTGPGIKNQQDTLSLEILSRF